MIESRLYSLEELSSHSPGWCFNVPIYQRLYVWGEAQVRTLLEDLCNACDRDEAVFFLGGTLVVEQQPGRFDLVDGQQRFTTLWLLAHAWRHDLEGFLSVPAAGGQEPRLRFSIRPGIDELFRSFAVHATGSLGDEVHGTERILAAHELMRSVFEKIEVLRGVVDREAYQRRLAGYAFRRVRFVLTSVPRQTDLNKLFEVINNRGVQLQHHEILKARILEGLAEPERSWYASLWAACSEMESFAEDGLCAHSDLKKHQVTDLHRKGKLHDAVAVLELLTRSGNGERAVRLLPLEEILVNVPEPRQEPAARDMQEPTRVRSVISFSLFLQHALRIWLARCRRRDLPRVLDRDLIALFQEHFFDAGDTSQVSKFLQHLWRLRVLFDRFMIKWVQVGTEDVHLINPVRVTSKDHKFYMQRPAEENAHEGLALLQSMLYHSQEITTQYWITPFLSWLEATNCGDPEAAFQYLRHLDNNLLGSEADDTLQARTRSFLDTPLQQRPLVHGARLAEAAGTRFAHYWFYKLEFVLWYLLRDQNKRWANFRMVARNSVEHISPQNPEPWDEDIVKDAMHHFGNLALVSRSINSEFSNRAFREKREQFRTRNRSRVDSLKMDLIYQSEHWSDELAFAHQTAMIGFMDQYCTDVASAAASAVVD